MDFYFDSYSELSLQRLMVSDKPRTDAFAEAIREILQGGERVIDVGTGSGLLAMLAAKSGAKKVYALDESTIAEAAKAMVAHNKLSETVEVIKSNATRFQLVEPVDVIISEWLGHFGFVEAMLDDVIVCRDENLKKEGTMLPSGIELMLAPLDSAILYDLEGPSFWQTPVHGIDFSPLEAMEMQQAIAAKTRVTAKDLIARPQAIISLDLATATVDDSWQSGEIEFNAEKDGRLDGFGGWFVAQLSPSVRLDTGPEAPMTHWKQTYFPFPPQPLKKGQPIKVKFALSKHPVEKRSLEFRLSVADQAFHYLIG